MVTRYTDKKYKKQDKKQDYKITRFTDELITKVTDELITLLQVGVKSP